MTTCKAHKSLLCLLKVGRPSCSPHLIRLQPSSLMSLSLLEEAGLSLMVRQTHAFYNPSLAKGRTQRCCKGQNVDTWWQRAKLSVAAMFTETAFITPYSSFLLSSPTLSGFKHKEMRGKLAIGITANFINRNTAAEAQVAEISGVARIYNQKFFQQLLTDTGRDPHEGRARSWN